LSWKAIVVDWYGSRASGNGEGGLLRAQGSLAIAARRLAAGGLQNLGGDCGCELALQNPTRTRTKLIPKREDVSFKSLIFI
jgi:hypothetical protein